MKLASRAARYAAYGIAGVVALLVAVALVLPRFLDQPKVEAEIQQRLSQAIQGQIAWEALRIQLLPSPRGAVRRVRVEAGAMHATIEEADVLLRLLPLFAGRAEISSVSVQRPQVRVELAPAAPASRKKPGPIDAMATYRAVMGTLAEVAGSFAPDTQLRINNGSVEIRSPGSPPLQIDRVSLRARSGRRGLELEALAGSNYWKQLKLAARIEFADLASSAKLDVAELAPQALLDRYFSDAPLRLALPVAALSAQLSSDGRKSVAGDIKVTAPALQLAGGERTFEVPQPSLAAHAELTAHAFALRRVSAQLGELALAGGSADLPLDGRGLTASFAEGTAGENAVNALWERLQLPKELLPRTPIRLAVSRLAYRPRKPLELAASARVGDGPNLTAELSWTAQLLDVRRATFKDADSDAALSLRAMKDRVEGTYSGALSGASLGALFPRAQAQAGRVEGKLRFSLDPKQPRQAVVEGNLRGEGLDLAWLTGQPIKIERADIASGSGRLRVREAALDWSGRKISLQGEIRRDPAGPAVEAQGELCGLSFPFSAQATADGVVAALRVSAKQRQLEQVAHCLSGQQVLITGDFDLQADLSTRGKLGELKSALKGTISAEARGGRVMKFALIGNILSSANVAALLEKDGPKLDDAGFPYRSLLAKARIEDGRVTIDESSFSSSAVGIAASGWISLLDYDSRLTVLVAPFGRLDRAVRKLPVVGYIIGGALTSVPVGVSGDIRDPLIVPLGPGAITKELAGIFERTVTLPAKLAPK